MLLQWTKWIDFTTVFSGVPTNRYPSCSALASQELLVSLPPDFDDVVDINASLTSAERLVEIQVQV